MQTNWKSASFKQIDCFWFCSSATKKNVHFFSVKCFERLFYFENLCLIRKSIFSTFFSPVSEKNTSIVIRFCYCIGRKVSVRATKKLREKVLNVYKQRIRSSSGFCFWMLLKSEKLKKNDDEEMSMRFGLRLKCMQQEYATACWKHVRKAIKEAAIYGLNQQHALTQKANRTATA